MSKRSRENKRLRKLAAAVNNINKEPIIGSFEQRADAIIKADIAAKGGNNGHVDIRLPLHYSGYPGTIWGNGWRNPADKESKQVDVDYRPIDHEKDKSVFNVISDDIITGECPIAKTPKVYVTTRLWNEWIALAEDYSTEWLAYLTGQFVKDDKGTRYEIRKMYFPPQIAHASHVDVDDDFTGYLPNTIGAIHSHVEMQVFFSGEDLAHSNWPVEIVVNAKGDVKVMIRHQLECGKWIKNYSEVMTVGDSANEKYIASLDKAFEAGELLRQQRVKNKSAAAGYRTPEINQPSQQPLYVTDYTKAASPSTATPILTYDEKEEWHFRINGKPMQWTGTEYKEVVKVNNEWIYVDDPILGSSQVKVNSQAVNAAIDAVVELNEETGQITVSNATGHSNDDGHDMGTRPATQEELDRLMEAEVDAASCYDCGGTGKIEVNDATIECTGCGGSGLKPEYKMGMGWEEGAC